MFGLGIAEVLIIGSLVVVMFGARRLPEVFTYLGKSMRSFKSGLHGEEEPRKIREVEEIKNKDPKQLT